jgi:hypothetical protein
MSIVRATLLALLAAAVLAPAATAAVATFKRPRDRDQGIRCEASRASRRRKIRREIPAAASDE